MQVEVDHGYFEMQAKNQPSNLACYEALAWQGRQTRETMLAAADRSDWHCKA